MGFHNIVIELRAERDRIDQAIRAIQELVTNGTGPKREIKRKTSVTQRRGRRGTMTAAARKRMSRMMKQRWAARKKQERAA